MLSKVMSGIERIPWMAVCVIVAIAVALSFLLEQLSVPPRVLSNYIERRISGHHPFFVKSGGWVAQTLLRVDRGASEHRAELLMSVGAQDHSPPPPVTHRANPAIVFVSSPAETIRAISRARPGEVITLLPGRYRFDGPGNVAVDQAGNETARITVRAERSNTVFLEFDLVEGFNVSAPYWTFENLHIRGVCQEHTDCEHAFHIVGKATHFIARNNTVVDFNAHIKINGEGSAFPDYGLIEGNTLTNTSTRKTLNPVSPIDLVAVSHWRLRRNLITDFVKAWGDQISTGAFAKGAGSDNNFEQNIVLCEHLLQGTPGQRVGISLGDGGTGKQFCRDQRCITEQDGGVIQSNLIASCSDDGIYINRAATNKILHNTLIDTGGISVRFVESSSDVQGNLVDGLIRTRDGGLLRSSDNIDTSASRLYLGLHPVRSLYVNANAMDFAWKGIPPRRNVADPAVLDLCGFPRPALPIYGAFEEFSACRKTQ